MSFDVVVVGAGPAGLAAAIRLRQLGREAGREITVAVVEKGAEVGAHILSGAVLDPRALTELIPDWAARGAPVTVPVRGERFLFLSEGGGVSWPHWLLPREFKQRGCYVVRLGPLCKWLAAEAEQLGVEVLPGFAAAELLTSDDGSVRGIATGEFGVGRDGVRGPAHRPGVELHAGLTVLAEGCRGSLAGEAMRRFGLTANSHAQTYGLGLKELWRLPAGRGRAGRVTHTAGWPLTGNAYGGGFVYELEDDLAAAGLVVALDYANPYLDPFAEFQRYKTHPSVRALLEGGERLAFGARSLTEGGLQALPQLAFPGGVLVGDAAGFLNVARSKGIHTAMKSGMLAAEAAFERISSGGADSGPLVAYPRRLKRSWLVRELRRSRNFRPAMRWGLMAGALYAGLDLFLLRGWAPWVFWHTAPDRDRLRDAADASPIRYPPPDGVLTFDRASSAYAAGVHHAPGQPPHLKLADERVPLDVHLPLYDLPEQRICPAGVYELVEGEGAAPTFRINTANCLHCKACEIKDPSGNILWTVPEGGGGPNYPGM